MTGPSTLRALALALLLTPGLGARAQGAAEPPVLALRPLVDWLFLYRPDSPPFDQALQRVRAARAAAAQPQEEELLERVERLLEEYRTAPEPRRLKLLSVDALEALRLLSRLQPNELSVRVSLVKALLTVAELLGPERGAPLLAEADERAAVLARRWPVDVEAQLLRGQTQEALGRREGTLRALVACARLDADRRTSCRTDYALKVKAWFGPECRRPALPKTLTVHEEQELAAAGPKLKLKVDGQEVTVARAPLLARADFLALRLQPLAIYAGDDNRACVMDLTPPATERLREAARRLSQKGPSRPYRLVVLLAGEPQVALPASRELLDGRLGLRGGACEQLCPAPVPAPLPKGLPRPEEL